MQRNRGFRIHQRERFIKRRIADVALATSRHYYGTIEPVVYEEMIVRPESPMPKVVLKCSGQHLHALADRRPMAKCGHRNCLACYGDRKEIRRKKIENRRVDVAA